MDKVYYISQGNTIQEHLMNIENVCLAGCKLIQLRLKNANIDQFKEAAIAARGICTQFGAKLIINDNMAIALEVKADGVHLGQDDVAPHEARQLLGDKIIGGTANTLEDAIHMINEGVDYIGLGPFKFTETKKQLSPILGAEGINNVCIHLKEMGHDIPVYAIGGINVEDLPELASTGAYGISVSGELSNKEVNLIQQAVEQIRNFDKILES